MPGLGEDKRASLSETLAEVTVGGALDWLCGQDTAQGSVRIRGPEMELGSG
jgi:hypothetical protein